MRLRLAGLVLLLIPGFAFAQAKGWVESIGFDGYIRPNCWTPMRIQLTSTVAKSETYRIQVVQEDLDGDHVAFTRTIPLQANPNGNGAPERVWVFFRPAPRMMPIGQSLSGEELSKRVRIYLCDERGKQLMQIAVPPSVAAVRNIDEEAAAHGGRGCRLIVAVGTSQSQPALDRLYFNARGINEEIYYIRLLPEDLPSNSLGYEAVDAIVWLDGDPTKLNSDAIAAIQDYVRDGGRLVVCQDENWQAMKDSELAGMLPVALTGTGKENGPKTLRKLAGIPDGRDVEKRIAEKATTDDDKRWISQKDDKVVDPWSALGDKPLAMAAASVQGGAIVVANVESDPRLPYLVRWMHGMGTVTWVAQNLGHPGLLTNGKYPNIGWDRVWDKVFDWPNDTITRDAADFASSALGRAAEGNRWKAAYGTTARTPDISVPLLSGMELPARGAALIGLAVVFFIVYWLAAGPGGFLWLKQRGKVQYTWMAFAACALVATGLTAILVRLVLRGPAKVQHITFVRVKPDGEALIQSQFGLYIPRDGRQDIALTGTDSKSASYLVAYPVHPAHRRESADILAYQDYEVAMRDRNSPQEPSISVPYRSTLKKFQARWVGKMPSPVSSSVSISGGALSGTLTNNTGLDLHDVWLIYRSAATTADDTAIFVPDKSGPAWRKGSLLDFAEILPNVAAPGKTGDLDRDRRKEIVGEMGRLNDQWVPYRWAPSLRGSFLESASQDRDSMAVVLSIYDRIAPSRQAPADPRSNKAPDPRYEILRRAGRQYDASAAISCGHLLVIARSDDSGPLPYPLEVNGRRIKGEGTVYYQFIIPLDRGADTTR